MSFSILNDQIPYFVLYPKSPLHILPPQVFGSTCFVYNLSLGVGKLSVKSLKCIFLGYHRVQKGYRCFSAALQRYFIYVDVSFFEFVPYFESAHSNADIWCPLTPGTPNNTAIFPFLLILKMNQLFHPKSHRLHNPFKNQPLHRLMMT